MSLLLLLSSQKVATLVDDFNDNSIATKWTTIGDAAQIKEQNTRLEITHSTVSQYNTLQSAGSYDLSSSSLYVEVVDAGNQGLASHQAVFGYSIDANNSGYFQAVAGQLEAWKYVAGVRTQIGTGITYSNTTHRCWRISESAGTISFDTSSNGTTWTNRWTLANPYAITSLAPYLQAGAYATEASGSYVYFDNFNTPPVAVGANTGQFFIMF